jgi:hypothetical protein
MAGRNIVDPVRRDTVRGLLAGYGVEDIAVMWRHPVERVRFVVRMLRESGALRVLVQQARENPRPTE